LVADDEHDESRGSLQAHRATDRPVEEYIWTTRAAAQAALDRAFATAAAPSDEPSRTRPATAPASRRSRTGARRAGDELGALSERLYEAVCRTPGETLTVIGPAVGATARQLNRPMRRLKQAGRIRSVGMRHATRYFPMAGEPQRST
jgi:hypothetical protein